MFTVRAKPSKKSTIQKWHDECLLHDYRQARRRDSRQRLASNEGRTVDALALAGDEGRDKLRKAAGRCKYPLIRRSPNGTTRQAEGLSFL